MDRFRFGQLLKKEGMDVLFRENDGRVYGITFVDHWTKCVFNGSDLGKGYTAKRLLERITDSGSMEQQRQEQTREALQDFVKNMDYSGGISSTLARIYQRGYRMETALNEYGNTRYYVGVQDGDNSVRLGGLQQIQHYIQGLFAQ